MHSKEHGVANAPQGIHVVAKPAGPSCNLACTYCFYLEKRALFGDDKRRRMADEVLSTFITKYIASRAGPEVNFVWQGGEPTLSGMDFFQKALELQRPFVHQKTIRNTLQTNGTLLTNEWCAFLKENNFRVGISLDGPQEVHDRYRRDTRGKGTFSRVLQGLRLLQKYGIEYNVLASVARDTAKRPMEVYRFLRDEGVEFVQFTPIVERLPDAPSEQNGLRFAGPASLDGKELQKLVTPWTVIPEEYGDFLIAVYEEWVRRDVGKVFVMNFEWALNAWIGNTSPVCVHAKQCGRLVAVEKNGDIYACDHCVYPQYKLGNIVSGDLVEMVTRSIQSGFGITKETALPRMCKECEVLAACRGGCPKHRFAGTIHREPGLHYLCAGYRKFFLHIRKYLRVMAILLENGLPPSYVMDAIKRPLMIKLGESRK